MSSLAQQLIAENKRTRDTFLDLGNCGLSKVPAEVGDLVWLESLSLASEWFEKDGQTWQQKRSRNDGNKNERLLDIGSLSRLTRLRSLIVEEVVDLTSLANLSALQSLAVSRTQVSDLSVLTPLISRGCPVRWSSEVWRGPGIYVEDCPLTTPPPEIVQQERRHP